MRILAFLLALLAAASPLRAASLPDPARFSAVIEQGNLAQAREWLNAGLSPDFEGKVIGTGVMIGAWEGNIPMMELFVSRGADVNKVNAFGEQALLHAAWKGKLAAVRWLVEHGARLNREGREWAALHYAAFAGHPEIVAYLLGRGADINALTTNGSTALMMAAREGRLEIAKSLLAAGARRDIVNERGDDALRWAIRYNNPGIAREIADAERIAAASAPAANVGKPVRSLPLPDRADMMLAQARKMEEAGRRDEALKLYRAALAAIRRAEPLAEKPLAPLRAATGLVITAQRTNPGSQTAVLKYATPASENEVQSSRADKAMVPPGSRGSATLTAANNVPAAAARGDAADEWLSRAREFEAAGRRSEALQAYRQAASALRTVTPSPSPRASPSPGPTQAPIDP